MTGLPDAIRSIFPNTVVQTCVVHVIRNAMRFVTYGDRKKIATVMRSIYTAPTLEGAELALKEFDKQWGEKYPGAIDVWKLAWDEFVPFLDYPAELRRIIYTTNAIESINLQLRKITKNRGHFPDKDAVERILLIGGGAQSPAVREIAPTVFGRPVAVPAPGEYVADGSARQAAWVISGAAGPPAWTGGGTENYDAATVSGIRERYAAVRDLAAT